MEWLEWLVYSKKFGRCEKKSLAAIFSSKRKSRFPKKHSSSEKKQKKFGLILDGRKKGLPELLVSSTTIQESKKMSGIRLLAGSPLTKSVNEHGCAGQLLPARPGVGQRPPEGRLGCFGRPGWLVFFGSCCGCQHDGGKTCSACANRRCWDGQVIYSGG